MLLVIGAPAKRSTMEGMGAVLRKRLTLLFRLVYGK